MIYIYTFILALLFVSPSVCNKTEIEKKSNKELLTTLQQLIENLADAEDGHEKVNGAKNTDSNRTGTIDNAIDVDADILTITNAHTTNTTISRSPFTASINVNTGPPSTNDTLSFVTNSAETMNIDGSGNVTITNLASQGVIHTDGSGVLSTSAVVGSDIATATIANANLATIDTANTPGAIVVRDSSGNFAAGTITANLIGNITGSASLNVLKTGDSMTGGLNMLNQQPVLFHDSTAGNYVGINAPTDVIASYTISLPDTAPTTGQTLRAGSVTATQLQWVSEGSSVTPSASRTIYVTQYGNDTTGDGSFDFPFASLAKAISVANGIASTPDPVTIAISSGTYIEDNSAGPLSINVAGISIIGESPNAVILIPNTPATNFLTVNETVYIGNATFTSLSPVATGISLTNGTLSTFNNLQITNFATGIECAGTTSSYLCELCTFINNGTGLIIDNTVVQVISCSFVGGSSLNSPPANTGLSITGSVSVCAMSGGLVTSCSTGLEIGSNSLLTASAVTFKLNSADVIQTAASHMTLSACTFAITTTATDVDIQISGTGTYAEIVGCQFNGKDINSIPQATALYLSGGATLALTGGGMKYYTTAIQLGAPSDTSTTQLTVSGFDIDSCTNDIVQQGSTSLNFNASTASSSRISISNPTNVALAYFDLDNNNALTVGTTADTDLDLLQAAVSTSNNPGLSYQSSLYSTQAIGVNNPTSNPSTSFVISNAGANLTAVTTDRTQAANINLFSDEGSPVGGTSALRGWDMQKTGTTASLAFNYQNSDATGQSVIPQYTVMQLNGVSNQLQLPTAGTQIVFDGDTNLYRSAADVLKTDSNFIVGTLTPGRAVITDPSTNQLESSVTTSTELSYLSGTTSSVQTQLNGKVAKAGDTMTGTLQLPAGSPTSPSLVFTGSTTSGLSASTGNLVLSTNGVASMTISSAGVATIPTLTPTGVVHNDASGNLSSSLITNTDISGTANIADSKLATITTAGKVANSATTATSADTPSTIVLRDSSGNFSAGTITASLTGNVTGSASLNVLKAGDTMTGTLILPAGSATSPSLKFTGSTNTGISALTTNTLSFDTNGVEAMNINATGGITIDAFTTAGVVHNSATGLLSSSLIVNADITPGTIANSSLATISSSNIPGDIVVRDGSGNFSTNEITIVGTVTNPTDAATKAYVDAAVSTGIVAKTPALVVSTTDIGSPPAGLLTIDGVTLSTNDRVLLVGQTNEVYNGIWLAQTGSWTYPTDWTVGSPAGEAYVLILSGDTYAGSSWLCNTPTAIIGTDPIMFAEFSLPNQVSGANVGVGTGLVYQSKTGLTLNFRTLAAETHMIITTTTNEIDIATDATNVNTASTIVARDASGNFSAGTITAALIGSASLNVLKTGDSMTGGLNMLSQQPVIFQDSTAGNYVGINAPTDVIASYTISLPDISPTTGQTLRAGDVTATQLQWVSEGSSVPPSANRTIYVTQSGNDITGDGSFDFPFASLAQAINTANSLSSAPDPVTIAVSSGTYTEDNSAGPLSVNVAGVSIIGESPISVIFIPNTPGNDFLTINATAYIGNATFTSSSSTATGISLNNNTSSILNNLQITNFATGIECAGTTSSYACELCTFINNGIGLFINDTVVEVNSCSFIGGTSLYSTPANIGLSITGSVSVCAMSGGSIAACATGLEVGNNALLTASAITFKLNSADVIQTAASHMTLSACTFAITTTATDVDVQISGVGTYAEILGCQFNGKNIASVPQATALYLSGGATLDLTGGGMKYYTTAIQFGAPSDTASTQLTVSGFTLENNTTDILQQGSTTLNFNASTASSTKININTPTNVNLAYFDLDNNNALTVGTTADTDLDLLQAAVSTSNNPGLSYLSSLYATQAIGVNNPTSNPSTSFVISNAGANLTAVTTDRTQAANINLFSDEGSPVGGTSALRGWDMQKTGTAASLAFNYQNSDASGQSVIPAYTVMQLNGVSNQLQLPTAGTQIVFDGDTNLYRSAADVLKTDSNFIVGTLTPGRAVITDPTTNQLESSVTTSTELSFLSGTTSSVQTQLNGKVAKAGDTMTGTLQLPAGSPTSPSLVFTGSTTSGLSASSGNLVFSTDGAASMTISSAGVVAIIDGFTTPGVVHNDASGNLSSSLVTNNDIIANAGITDSKLATITTAGKVANSATTATSANTPSTIVLRDSSGNFSAGTITASLNGNATTATTAVNFSGSLAGEVTGPQTNTVVTNAVSTDTANAIVRRDASGNFSTNNISLDGNLILDESTSSTVGNITKGANSFIHNFGTNNTFVGENSGNFVMTGTSNSVFGNGALPANTTGTGNIAVGYQSLNANTTGSGNTASGFRALSLITTGTNNVAFGSLAGSALTSANSSNIDISNIGTSGDNGVIRIGTAGTHTTNFQAGIYNVTPGATGVPVFISSTGQLGTVGVGANYSAIAPTAATDNNGIIINNATSQINLEFADATHNGIVSTAAQSFTGTKTFLTAVNTPIITSVSGGVITIASGASQYPIGTGALVAVTSGTDLIAIGTNALAADTSGSRNIGIGSNALSTITTSNDSTAIGFSALKFNTASQLTAVGSGALQANTTGAGNVALGCQSLNANTSGSFNTAVGFQSLDLNTTGTNNSAFGYQALLNNTGFDNTAVGVNALINNTSGTDNTAMGINALNANTTSSKLTAVGSGALQSNSSGAQNVAVGYQALNANTTASGNTAIGWEALTLVTTGTNNTALGSSAGANLTVANSSNIDIGNTGIVGDNGVIRIGTTGTHTTNFQAGIYNINPGTSLPVVISSTGQLGTGTGEGTNYTAIAPTAATDNNGIIIDNATSEINLEFADATHNGIVSTVAQTFTGTKTFATAVNTPIITSVSGGVITIASGASQYPIGTGALAAGPSGTDLIAMGTNALAANTSGSRNIGIGSNALSTITTNNDSTAVGFNALKLNTASQLTAFGSGALQGNTSGTGSVAVGYQALQANTTGFFNTAVGYQALDLNTTGTSNTATGYKALLSNTTGTDNTALGVGALQNNTTGTDNVAIGVNALTTNTTDSQLVAIGSGALQNYNNTLGQHVAIGYMALHANNTGGGSRGGVAIGWKALQSDISSSGDNTAVGSSTLQASTTGHDNTAVGNFAMFSNTTGSNNTGIGSSTLFNTTGNQNTAVGSLASTASTTGSDNTSVGYFALGNNTASQLTAVGSGALQGNTSGTGNVAVGYNALVGNTTGNNNTAVGYQALIENTTGNNNTAVGYNALDLNTTGTNNSAFGYQALMNNTTGFDNTASGFGALQNNATGTDNTAMGINALNVNTATSQLTAIGSGALQNNTTGVGNTATGYQALNTNRVGNRNTADGYQTLFLNDETVGTGVGNDNVGVGYQALFNNVAGFSNTAVGSLALFNNTTGFQNSANGNTAMNGNTTGFNNTAHGYQSLFTNATGTDNTAFGFNTLKVSTVSQLTAVGSGALAANTTGTGNVAVGYQALTTNTTGIQNTAVGYQALDLTTTGTNNSAFGYQALMSNTTGFDNTASGVGALLHNTSGTDNTAMGINALNTNTTTSKLTAIGSGALQSNTSGTQNTAVGYQSLQANTTGTNSTAVGYQSLFAATGANNTAIGNIAGTAITSGTQNTALGSGALKAITTVGDNVAIGYNALTVSTAAQNTAVGSQALASNTTGTQNTAVGYQTLDLNTTGTNNSAFGYQALLNNTGFDNTAIGVNALLHNTSGTDNTAMGINALNANITISGLTAVGSGALQANTTGTTSVAVGYQALALNQIGSNNTAVGYQAGHGGSFGSDNTAIGYQTLLSSTSSSRGTAVGSGALQNNTTGSDNVAVGYQSLNVNTTGTNNVAVGFNALLNNNDTQLVAIGSGAMQNYTVSGFGAGNAQSVAVGYNALSLNVSGSNNTAVGWEALANDVTTSNGDNTAVGASSLTNNTTGTGNTALGAFSLQANSIGY